MRNKSRWTIRWTLIGALAAFSIAGYGQAAAAEAVASQEVAAADAKREAELAAREQALAAKEAELARALQEAELARTRPVAQPTPITVPAGTRLSVSLASDVSTKTAKVGDPVHARLAADVIVDGRTVVAAGTPVHGTVTQVVSGSNKIGGVPTLGLAFDGVDFGNGKTVPIAGQIVQQGKSETAKDTGKILGGAALGAIIGHKMGDDKGTVIGGVLGGAAGAAAAHETGGEVTLTAGSVLVFATEAPFEVSGA